MKAQTLKGFFGKNVKVADFQFFIGMVETQETTRRKGGYYGYQSHYDFGKFLIYKNEIWKVGLECNLIVSKRKRNYKTYWKEITLGCF